MILLNLPASSTNTTTNTLTFAGATSFSDISGGELSALPAALLDFSGVCAGDEVQLKWRTASEVNNSHFEIERSMLGQEFIRVASIPGVGNSNEINVYSWIDTEVLPGANRWYRLRQVDFDGTEEVFGPVAVSEQCLTLPSVVLLPQPAVNALQLRISSAESGPLQYRILSMQGQLLLEGNTMLFHGINVLDIRLDQLGDAWYVLELKQNEQIRHHRFIKTSLH